MLDYVDFQNGYERASNQHQKGTGGPILNETMLVNTVHVLNLEYRMIRLGATSGPPD